MKAPDFTLEDQRGNAHNLSSYQGQWVVLYFYPKDDTPGCTIEAQEFTKHKEDFEDEKIVVLGISTDDKDSHCAFEEKHGLDIVLLADTEHEVSKAYSTLGELSWNGMTWLGAKRTTVLINPEGEIAYRWDDVDPEGHALVVLEKVREMQ